VIYIDLLTYLSTYLCLFSCVVYTDLTYLSTYLYPFSCVIYIDLLTYLSTYLPTYLPTYLSIYLPTYLSTYLPTYALSHVWYIWDSGFFIIIEPTATELYVPPNSLKPQGDHIPKN
jgi:hypothetical protein